MLDAMRGEVPTVEVELIESTGRSRTAPQASGDRSREGCGQGRVVCDREAVDRSQGTERGATLSARMAEVLGDVQANRVREVSKVLIPKL
jgi:hypothetical protein